MLLAAVAVAALERFRAREAEGGATWLVRVVHDGDTVTCDAPDGTATKIRLLGIDAPESSQAWGSESRAALARMVADRRVTVVSRGHDQYGRLLGTLFVDGRDVNREMVVGGHAWVFGRVAPDPDLVAAESLARRERRGLWAAGNPEEPSRWRDSHPHEP